MEDVVKTKTRGSHFWRGRRVFVTGHTGFKGGWLVLWLKKLGAEVTGYALIPPTQPSLFELVRIGESISSVIGDVRDRAKVFDAMQKTKPEIVFHLAAQPLVRQSYADPVETYAVNVVGTASVLEAVRQTESVRAVVNVTSDKCYENHEWVWGYRETDRLGGHDPYSNSKACAELVAQAFRDSFFSGINRQVALASVRAGNVIGGGDWAVDRLLPDFFRAILAGRTMKIRHPKSIRPWQHVLDPLNGYLILAERLLTEGSKWAGSWNFGPRENDAKTVQWLIERGVGLWGRGATWELDSSQHAYEAQFLRLDISKARQELGWMPAWTIEEALARTVEWFRAYSAKQDLRDFTLRQIEDFEKVRVKLESAQ